MKLSQSCPATLWLGQYRSTVRRRATSRKLKRGQGTSLGAQKRDQVITYRAAPKCFKLETAQTHRESSVPGWVFPVKLGGMCDPVPKTITIFMTKICHFAFPFYDLAKISYTMIYDLTLESISTMCGHLCSNHCMKNIDQRQQGDPSFLSVFTVLLYYYFH